MLNSRSMKSVFTAKNTMPYNPTPYKISTITATGGINSIINLDLLYDNLFLEDYNSDVEGFVYIEYGKKKTDTYYRGFNKKLSITRRKKTESKRFDNQATIIFKVIIHPGVHQHVNVKMFRNGNIQMTGVKRIEQCGHIIDKLIEQIRMHHANGIEIVSDVGTLMNVNNQIRLINSDFRIGFDIKRDKLYKILQSEYGVFCSFEPCIYPGAKVQFYWNESQHKQDGICKCSSACCGKGTGKGEGQCKKITIAVFQSGCIIITGAQTYKQIDDAYDFICAVLKEHMTDLEKKQLAPWEEMISTLTS